MTQPNVSAGSPRRHNGGPSALPEKIARALGWRRHRAEAAIWGPFNYGEICARIIVALRQASATDTLAKFTAPIIEALNGSAPRLTAEIQLAAREADAAEDLASERFNLDRRRAHRDALIQALDREIIAKTAERAALAAESL